MAAGPERREFLDRGSYRQRRMRDAGRLLPIFATLMCLLPLLWPRDGGHAHLTSTGLLFLFGLWVVLIALAAALARVLRDDETRAADDEEVPR